MLLERLIERQAGLRLNDSEFAHLLGVKRSTWQLTRTGMKPVRWSVASGAVAAFPDLADDATLFLRHSATRSTDTATPRTAKNQEVA